PNAFQPWCLLAEYKTNGPFCRRNRIDTGKVRTGASIFWTRGLFGVDRDSTKAIGWKPRVQGCIPSAKRTRWVSSRVLSSVSLPRTLRESPVDGAGDLN